MGFGALGALQNNSCNILGNGLGVGLDLDRPEGDCAVRPARGTPDGLLPSIPTPLLAPSLSISSWSVQGLHRGDLLLPNEFLYPLRLGQWHPPLSFHISVLTKSTFIYVSSSDLFLKLQTPVSPLRSLIDVSY